MKRAYFWDSIYPWELIKTTTARQRPMFYATVNQMKLKRPVAPRYTEVP